MGTGSKTASVFLRVFELISAAIVAGLVGEYLHYVSDAHAHAESRLVYTVSLAGISLIVCLVCMIPFNFAFYGFVLDFILFIMWMTSFGLLIDVSSYLHPFLSIYLLRRASKLTFFLYSSPVLLAAIPFGIGIRGATTTEGGMSIRYPTSVNPLWEHQHGKSVV